MIGACWVYAIVCVCVCMWCVCGRECGMGWIHNQKAKKKLDGGN